MNNNRSKHILIVEDSVDLQYLLGGLFKRAGYTLSQAYDGHQALQMLKGMSQNPCMILLDIMMPVMDGIEFRQQQKNDPQIANIPVVIMTADSKPETLANQLEVNHYFAKPLTSIDQLLQVTSKMCG